MNKSIDTRVNLLLVTYYQVLANFSDLDDYYDVVDCLEEQGMEGIMNVCDPCALYL